MYSGAFIYGNSVAEPSSLVMCLLFLLELPQPWQQMTVNKDSMADVKSEDLIIVNVCSDGNSTGSANRHVKIG